MAGKKRKKRKSGFSVFAVTFFLTLLAGCVAMLVYWALWGMNAGGHQEPAVIGEQIPVQEEHLAVSDELYEDTAEETTEETAEEITEGESAAEEKGKYDDLLADTVFCEQNKIYGKETADPEEVTLVFGGDILFDERYAVMAQMIARGQGVEGSISGEMLQVMRNADICMINNEFPYTDRGEALPEKAFTFRANPQYASYLRDMGVDVVSLANNHAYDYGEISLRDSIDTLDSVGVAYVGAGVNLDEAVKPVTFVVNDLRIAILSATQIERYPDSDTPGATADSPGVFRCLDVTRLLEEVAKARAENDFVIVYIHWGSESTDQPDWGQLEQAPQIAEAGADLIIGDHPHVLQGITYCGDTPVFYSLGNYLFNSKSQDTCLIEAKLDENGLKSIKFIPGLQQNCSVSMHHGEESERVLSYIRELSPGVTISEEGYVGKAE